jgi:ATP-dependent RNA helicase RhlB
VGFEDLGLPEPLLQAVRSLGFMSPTPIQAEALPQLLAGRDLMGQAQTGTGKTACFLLATMKTLLESQRPAGGAPRALIVAPTRELAIQIAADAAELSVHTDLETALAFGGTRWETQAQELRAGTDIVVGTPGRLIDYYKRGVLKLNHIEVVVIDECDRLFDMGFIDDLTYLMRALPRRYERQCMLFTATLSDAVLRLAWRHMNDPLEVKVQPERVVVESVEQNLYHVASHEKVPLMLGLFRREQPTRAMIFVNMKRTGEELAWRLTENGHPTVYMSGDLPQHTRTQIIEALKDGRIRLLVATDVASRGLHVDDISHVFNYDVPQDPEDYVHRIGRTARAGAAGWAITLACEDYATCLPAVETFIGHRIPVAYADNDILPPDRSGRYPWRRNKPFVGWPPTGRGPTATADKAAEPNAPGPRRRGRRRRRGTTEPGAAQSGL